MKISRIILIVLLFFVFFEIGLFSSYTLATGEVPDPGELIGMQVGTISSIFSPDNVGGFLIKDPDNINVTNKYKLADKVSEVADVDGVNVENMTITTVDDTNKQEFNVTITAFGYSKPKGKGGSIIISNEPDYKIICTGIAKYTINGIEVDLDTVKVDSILKIFDANDNNKYTILGNDYNSSSKYKSSSKSSSSSSYSSGSSSSGSSYTGDSGGSSSSGSSSGGSSSGSSGGSSSGGSSSGGSSSGSSGGSSSGGSSSGGSSSGSSGGSSSGGSTGTY